VWTVPAGGTNDNYGVFQKTPTVCRMRVIRDGVEPAASPGMVRYAVKSESELSCRDPTGTNTMTEIVTVNDLPVANGAATVSAPALALHLDCSRTYIGKLEAEGRDPAAR
jgi:hypothetical protein